MMIKNYGPVTQPRVMVAEDISGFSLWIDGYQHFIPRDVLPEVVRALGQQLPADVGVFNLLSEMVTSHFIKCASVMSAEGE